MMAMSDYYALLDEPHRPWLDPEGLKKKFLTLSAEVHPDRVHEAGIEKKRFAEQRYAELNQAYQHLRHPKERLQHLLELETGAKPSQVQQIPADLMQFFVEVGQLLKETDGFLAEKTKTFSPLLQVQLFEAGQALTDRLNELQRSLTMRQQELTAELQAIDARWVEQAKADPVARATMLRRLEQLYRLFSYYARWQDQIQERIVELAM
jgi:DnaJ-domain-containing protein 1